MRPLYPGGRGTPRPRHPGGRGTPRPLYSGGRVITRPSTPGLPILGRTPPGPRIPRPRTLVYSPPPPLTPTTYQEDTISANTSLLPHHSLSLPAHKVSPYTALLPNRDEICLSSGDEGGEMMPVSLPVLPAGITISRIGKVT